MNLLRRQFLQLAAGAVAAPAVARRAVADAYPSRPVRLIVGFTPAGGNDIIARLMGQWLTERLGQTFVIENRPGASTNIAAELVINSPPDGYTLFITNLSNAINATLYEKLNFDFMRDMLPVAGIAQAPAVFAINASVPARTVTEFIAHAKANPDRINMGSAGIGSTGHLAASFYGIGAPRSTPAEIVAVLNKAVNAGLADPKLKARLTELGNVPLPGPPATFGKLIADETEKWGKVIRFAGIKSQ